MSLNKNIFNFDDYLLNVFYEIFKLHHKEE